VVNLKETIRKKQRSFMIELQEACSKDITLLEIEVLQVIIKHKWKTYTRSYYLR
jgi:hypothetical protein